MEELDIRQKQINKEKMRAYRFYHGVKQKRISAEAAIKEIEKHMKSLIFEESKAFYQEAVDRIKKL